MKKENKIILGRFKLVEQCEPNDVFDLNELFRTKVTYNEKYKYILPANGIHGRIESETESLSAYACNAIRYKFIHFSPLNKIDGYFELLRNELIHSFEICEWVSFVDPLASRGFITDTQTLLESLFENDKDITRVVWCAGENNPAIKIYDRYISEQNPDIYQVYRGVMHKDIYLFTGENENRIIYEIMKKDRNDV